MIVINALEINHCLELSIQIQRLKIIAQQKKRRRFDRLFCYGFGPKATIIEL